MMPDDPIEAARAAMERAAIYRLSRHGTRTTCPHCRWESTFSADCYDCGLPAPLRDRDGEARCYACHESTHRGNQMYDNDPDCCPHCQRPFRPAAAQAVTIDRPGPARRRRMKAFGCGGAR